MPVVGSLANASARALGWNGGAVVFNIDVFVFGGGGGGGGAASTNYAAGGGGGAGYYGEGTYSVRTGAVLTITVGAGGSGGSTSGSAGGDGESSSLSGPTSTGGSFSLIGDGGGGGGGTTSLAHAPQNVGGSGGGGGIFGSTRTNPYRDADGANYSGGFATIPSNNTSNWSGGGGGADTAGFNGADGGGGGDPIEASNIVAWWSGLYGTGGNGVRASETQNGASGDIYDANRGHGGNGARRGTSGSATGGAGGTGVVVFRVPTGRTPTFSAGTNTLVSSSGGFNIYSCTSTGTRTVTFS